MTWFGHSEEWPTLKPLFAMTTLNVQRQINTTLIKCKYLNKAKFP